MTSLEALLQDLRYAARSYRKTPVFTLVALVTLTLAIGANTAIFSLLNALVLRDLPVRDPGTLVQLSSVAPGSTYESGLTFPMFRELPGRQQIFSSVIGWLGSTVMNIQTEHDDTRGAIWVVTANFYSELGVRPMAGRTIGPGDVDDTTLEPARVAVIGYSFWQRHYGGNRNAIGQRIRVEGQPFTIVGIAPEGFRGLNLTVEPDVTLPLTAYPLISDSPVASLGRGTSFWVRTTGRLKPGVTIEQARAALDTLWPELKRATVPAQYAGSQRDRFLATRLSVTPAGKGVEQRLRDTFLQPLVIVLGIASLILLIACVNLASLMLSRAAARTHEMGVRLALGAGRVRIGRQMLIEGLLLAAAGAAGGVLFAFWSSAAMVKTIFQDYLVTASLDVTPDSRVVAFTAALATLVGVLFSVAPAWAAARVPAVELLQQSARTTSGSGRVGKWLVATQVGLSLILLTAAGLLVRTLQEIRSIDAGMRPDNVVVAYPAPRPGGYGNVNNDVYYPALVDRMQAVPGVQRAAVALFKPAGGGVGGGERVSTIDSPADGSGLESLFMSISPGFFETIGIGLKGGRDFAWSDDSRAPSVAIVSESLARRLFPDGNVIGRHIRAGVLPRRQDSTIVGIVANAHVYDLKDPNLSAVYVPALQEPNNSWKCVIVRGRGVSFPPLSEAIASLGYERSGHTQALSYITDRVLLKERVTAMLATFFGGLALLLAAIGLYGLMSYAVAQRRREIGIRIALGADARRVVRTVVGEGLRVTLGGVAVGCAAALVAVRLVKSLLFGVSVYDPLTLVAAPALLVAIAIVACLVPALRAARVDPVIALRAE